MSSDGFNKSARIRNFLQFVVSETLAGRDDRIKEYVIGMEVFERDSSFDPKTNAVVRVEASRMRRRLRQYFLGPGHDDPIHIELPTGRYVPRFRKYAARREDDAGDFPAAETGLESRLALPDKPSIAVLPFTILGGDAGQDYLADGIAEDLITALSRIHSLFVTARNSTFTYKGRAVDVKHVGREMGVRYVLEGSVRQTGKRIRVSAQLIDATKGIHLWAERYDRVLNDIFALQDEIADTIAAAVEPELGAAERERAVRRPPESLEAWGLYQRGLDHLYRFSMEDIAESKILFRAAAHADPRFASPLGALAYANFMDYVLGFSPSPKETLDDALKSGQAGVARDEKDPMAHFGLGRALDLASNWEAAVTELEIALELNPNFALAHLGLGSALSAGGRFREAEKALSTAIRLSPHDPILWTMEHLRAIAHLELGDFDRALVDAKKAYRSPNTNVWLHLTLISVLIMMDHIDEAKSHRRVLFAKWPDFSMAKFAKMTTWDRVTRRRWLEGLRKADLGMPDNRPADN
jgi:TolB-like protein